MNGFTDAARATDRPLGGGQISKNALLRDRDWGIREKMVNQTGY